MFCARSLPSRTVLRALVGIRNGPKAICLRVLSNDSGDRKLNIWTVPNAICLARIAACPLIVQLVVNNHHFLAFTAVALAGASDVLDGYIARKYPGQKSSIGSILDPLADKILVGSLFLSLGYVHLIPVPLVMLVLGKDLYLIASSIRFRYNSLSEPRSLASLLNPAVGPMVRIRPNVFGKLCTASQLTLVVSSLGGSALGFDVINSDLMHTIPNVTAVTTVAAGLSYAMSKKAVKIVKNKH